MNVSDYIMVNVSIFRTLRGGIFLYHSEYFTHAENLELVFFCSTAFVDKIIRGM